MATGPRGRPPGAGPAAGHLARRTQCQSTSWRSGWRTEEPATQPAPGIHAAGGGAFRRYEAKCAGGSTRCSTVTQEDASGPGARRLLPSGPASPASWRSRRFAWIPNRSPRSPRAVGRPAHDPASRARCSGRRMSRACSGLPARFCRWYAGSVPGARLFDRREESARRGCRARRRSPDRGDRLRGRPRPVSGRARTSSSCPLHSGGGIRVKILDGWLWGLPVVSTVIGAEGIEARPGEDILLAPNGDPAAFADAVVRVLTDPALNARLRHNGRAAVEARYGWQAVYGRVNIAYQALLDAATSRNEAPKISP